MTSPIYTTTASERGFPDNPTVVPPPVIEASSSFTGRPLDDIIEYDRKTKGDNFDKHIGELVALFEDSETARQLIVQYTKMLGLGLEKNTSPPQNGILEFIIERLSGRYDAPPTRRLKSAAGRLLSEDSTAHKAMLELYDDLAMDSVMAVADRYSNLCGSVFLRVYPGPSGLRMRMFTPDLVHRVPDPALADEVDADQAIALKLAADVYEIHERTAGGWMMRQVTKEGQIMRTIGPEVYGGVLPIIRFDSTVTLGRAWLPPRLSRASYVKVLSGLSADLQSLTALQAHSILVFLTQDENRKPPEASGHGAVAKIFAEDDLRYEQAQPFADQLIAAIKAITETFLMGERIPIVEARGDRAATGAALRVQERPLKARREAGRPLAVRAEKQLWKVIQTLSAVHYGTELAGEELIVSLASADTPEDDTTILDAGAKGMALGVISPVQVVQRLYSVPRTRAIEMLEQAHEDIEAYPPPAPNGAAQVDEGDPADIVAGAAGEGSGDSVTDTARGESAADAREERR